MNENKFKLKKIFIIFLFLLTLALILFSLINDNKNNKLNKEKEGEKTEIVNNEEKEFCYYKSTLSAGGFSDIAWLKVKEVGTLVSGEMRNLPAETDSKIGLFEGQIVEIGSFDNIKKANVIWDTLAEGMRTKEELVFEYGEQYAIAYFGEVIERSDGVYVFKNKDSLYPQEKMQKMDCLELGEKINVEKYIRDNIKNLSKVKEVLGGNWYVTIVKINPVSNSGEVTYEDGHIEEKAMFTYSYDTTNQETTILTFEQK